MDRRYYGKKQDLAPGGGALSDIIKLAASYRLPGKSGSW
jgi:hypothetical protein